MHLNRSAAGVWRQKCLSAALLLPLLTPFVLPVGLEATAVIGGTVLGCIVLTEVIRRVPPLRPLVEVAAEVTRLACRSRNTRARAELGTRHVTRLLDIVRTAGMDGTEPRQTARQRNIQ